MLTHIRFSFASAMLLPVIPKAQCHTENQYHIGHRMRGIVSNGCSYVCMWHVADKRYPQWLFFVTNDAFECMPNAKHLMCSLNLHLLACAVAESKSLAKEGWSEVEFHVEWEKKEMMFQGLGLEAFAHYVQSWIRSQHLQVGSFLVVFISVPADRYILLFCLAYFLLLF